MWKSDLFGVDGREGGLRGAKGGGPDWLEKVTGEREAT